MSSSLNGMNLLPWDVLELLPLRENTIGDRERDRCRTVVCSFSPPGSLLREEMEGCRWIEEFECV